MPQGRKRTRRDQRHHNLRNPRRRRQDRGHLDRHGNQPRRHVARKSARTPHAKANAAWRNGYYRGFQEEIARRYQVLRLEMESDGTGKELVTVRSGQVDQWIETHVTFITDKPKLPKTTRPSQAIGLKETGAAGNWTLEK